MISTGSYCTKTYTFDFLASSTKTWNFSKSFSQPLEQLSVPLNSTKQILLAQGCAGIVPSHYWVPVVHEF